MTITYATGQLWRRTRKGLWRTVGVEPGDLRRFRRHALKRHAPPPSWRDHTKRGRKGKR